MCECGGSPGKKLESSAIVAKVVGEEFNSSSELVRRVHFQCKRFVDGNRMEPFLQFSLLVYHNIPIAKTL